MNAIIENLELIGKVIVSYSKDNNGKLPLANNWCDILMKYDNSLKMENFRHPKYKGIVIAFNRNLSGMDINDIPKDTILLSEAKGEWNVSGDEELLRNIDSNRLYAIVLYVDQRLDTYWLTQKMSRSKVLNYFDSPKFIAPLKWKP